jgi:hypothetical protein
MGRFLKACQDDLLKHDHVREGEELRIFFWPEKLEGWS